MSKIPHASIADPYIHEPKGISGTTENDVYVADGAGSGAWEQYSAATGYTLIEKAIPAAASTITFDFDETLWNSLMICFQGLRSDTAANTMGMRLGHTGGTIMSDHADEFDYLFNSHGDTIWSQAEADAQWNLTDPRYTVGRLNTNTVNGRILIKATQRPLVSVNPVESHVIYNGTAGPMTRHSIGVIGKTGTPNQFRGRIDHIELNLELGLFVPSVGPVSLFGLIL